jgi:phospholipase A-2-activating protein
LLRLQVVIHNPRNASLENQHVSCTSPTNSLQPVPLFAPQIVKFVIDNTGAKGAAPSTADMPITGGFCDPFTGGSSSAAAEQRPPPFYGTPAGSSAAAAALPLDITGGFVDPFTGGSSSSSRAQQQERQLPARAYMLFDNAPPADGLRRKLLEFSAALVDAEDVPPDALIGEEEAAAGGV